MSLLNEALRKRSRSLDQAGKKDIFQTDRASHRKGKARIYGLVGIVVLLGFFTVAGVWFGFLRADARPRQKTFVNHYAVRRQTIVTEPVRLPEPPKMPVKQEPKAETIIAATSEQKEAKPYNTNLKEKEIAKGGREKEKKLLKTNILKPKKERKNEPKQKAQKTTEAASKPDDQASEALFIEKAMSYHRRNNLDMAIQMYRELLRKNPEHFDALLNLSSAYIQSSQYSQAYPLLQKLKRLNPENAEVLLNFAVVEIGLGRPNSAIDYLAMSESLKDGPQFEIYFHRGVALSYLNRLDEALTWYKKAEELRANDPLLIFNMAVACDKLERYDEALRYYVTVMKNNSISLSAKEKKEIEARIAILRVYTASI
jgi:tetratricopeptide (TPR) repeat protein